MDDDVVIRIRGLKKSYKILDFSITDKRFNFMKHTEYPIFNGLDLDVHRGDIIGILGRNGCGKSTFLKLVSEVLEPDEGTIEVKGKVASILELSMGFHPDLSGRDNIILRSELYGISRSQVLEHIDDIVKYSDLGVFIDNPVRTYSSGMRSRLAFAVMINVDADIFLVDEALSTGDMAFASKASEHLKNLVRSGKTVLFTSHSTSTIKRTCNRAIWLSNCNIAMDGPADEVVEAYGRSINDSVEDTMSLAEGGASSAQYRLSTFYRDGLGVEKDPEKRRYWLEQASLREHPMAMAEMGDILISEGDEEKAMSLYQRAADNGNFEARRKYATMQGDTNEEIENLRTIMKDLASTEYPYDLYNYGNLMYRSALIPADYQEAFEYLTKASEAGWLDADVLLAQMYREGNGVERSMEKFVERLTYAAENGHAKAMSMLADAYYDAKYIKKDAQKAFEWYMKAACTGNMKAQYQVAVMLSSGAGCEKNEDEAKKWFARYSSTALNDSRKVAMDTLKTRHSDFDITNDMLKSMSKSYHTPSMVSLASKYDSGKGFKKSPKAAIDLLEKASLAGGAPRTRLADKYLESEDEEVRKKAFGLLESAAKYGDNAAMYKLAIMYKDGTLCEADENKYRMYMRMASERGNRDAKEVVMKWDNRINRRKKNKEKDKE
ncbi:MAG: SEL1-like repeat protein [Candidatus Methanomethylophilaceae archaeon]|nr:SEL1-like repeat protein [Candidatus Methanomethylophilaceae archaeon]